MLNSLIIFLIFISLATVLGVLEPAGWQHVLCCWRTCWQRRHADRRGNDYDSVRCVFSVNVTVVALTAHVVKTQKAHTIHKKQSYTAGLFIINFRFPKRLVGFSYANSIICPAFFIVSCFAARLWRRQLFTFRV